MTYRLLTILIICIASNGVLASTSHRVLDLNPNKRLEIDISKDGVNRIEAKNFEILELIGDESLYDIHWASDGNNFFVYSKDEVIDVTLLDIDGKAQDLRLNPKDIDSSTTILQKKSHIKQAPVDQILTAIKSKQLQKYFALNLKLKPKYIYEHKIKVKTSKLYHYKGLNVIELYLSNSTKQISNISIKELTSMFRDTIAIVSLKGETITDIQLPRKSNVKLFVITRGSL